MAYEDKLKKIYEEGSKEEKFNWDFYHKKLYPKDIMIIAQNPKKGNEKKEIPSSTSYQELVKDSQKGLLKYFRENKKFWDKFFSLIDINDSQKALNWVHFTDIVKRKSDKEPKPDDKNLLREEIERVNPNLIICFGGIAWDFLRGKSSNNQEKPLKRISENTSKKEEVESITDEHGYLFWDGNHYIIPLIHYSGNSYSMCPRESYWDYFKEGLEYNKN